MLKCFLLYFINLIVYVYADDVLGCNGFVKSDLNIDLSKVFVKLFTKQGSLKDQTECAPTNGYYFLPLYDKGDYVIKVSTPTGWSFDPPEVAISVDGVNDPCSKGKDINFVFNGFAISGKVVSEGFDVGPPGIEVALYDNSSKNLIKTKTTDSRGSFLFTPVKPGAYFIKASHPKWKLNKNTIPVSVVESNGEIPVGSLSVAGYDVSGSVTSEKQPISGVSFVLFGKNKNKKMKVEGCDSSDLEGFSSSSLADASLLCHITSNADGQFSFPQLSPGDYTLVPHYKGAGAKFNIIPTKLDFTVAHSSLVLNTIFQVQGFSVSGKVLWNEGGQPMPQVQVYLNGNHVTTTNQDGVYVLDGMRAATYQMNFKAGDVIFNEISMKVTGRFLPEIFPDKFKVSGQLSSGDAEVIIVGPDGFNDKISVDSSGHYSTYLKRGVYSFSALPSNKVESKGLQFSPKERKVAVIDKPISGIIFSKLHSTVQGRIQCMGVCPSIVVNLKPKDSGSTISVTAEGGDYTVKEVLPGDYDLFIEGTQNWCWEKEMHTISVTSELTKAPLFKQSGFIMSFVSSHATKVVYKSEDGKNGEVLVGVGGTQVCVPSSSTYTLEPVGCHRYQHQKFKWTPQSPPVRLLAISHAHKFSLATTSVTPDLQMVASYPDGSSQGLTKLSAEEKKEDGKLIKLIYTVYLNEGDKIILTPASKTLLFSPQTAEMVGQNDCVDSSLVPLFTAELGKILTGKVVTANNIGLKGVTVFIINGDGTLSLTLETSSDGRYSTPPIRNLPGYQVKAEKEGYVITGPNSNGDFSAHKLAEIIVKVVDKASSLPLQGVLLSLSGGEKYRRNAQTSQEGTLTFLSLSPGEYFLRPMMKEYKFTPGSQTIKVTEGATQNILLSGTRVAYSGIGTVSSLNGDGEAGVIVEAVGIGSCHLLQEEATSGANGHFRIRGLQSGCEYKIQVKKGMDINQHIFKSSPEYIVIKVPEGDVTGLELFGYRNLGKTDIIVHVVVDRPEDMKTLRVKVTREDSPDHVVLSAKLADYRPTSSYSLPSVIVSLSGVPSDGSQYLISLESSLARATHDYALRAVRITADSPVKVAKLTFAPTARTRDPEPAQTSYLALPLMLILLLIYYYRLELYSLVTSFQSNGEESMSQTFAEAKRKMKIRKVQ